MPSGFLPRPILWGCLLLGMMFCGGCLGPHLQYDLGWTTRTIDGLILNEEGLPLPKNSFIVVKSYFPQFIEINEQPFYSPQASLAFIDPQGFFRVPFDWRASKIELNFIAPGYAMDSFLFQRQMGIGDLHYQKKLLRTNGWQDHLYVSLSPFLQDLILEPRYNLPQAWQKFIGDWLEEQKAQAAPVKNRSDLEKLESPQIP